MASLGYDLASYRSYLRFSHRKHLLVEGSDDKRVFMLFFDELLRRAASPKSPYEIMIDSAEHLIDFGSKVSNCEKIELVCQGVSGLPCAERLVGFVDRDFRGFECDPYLKDSVGAHKVSGRLVWSRGHSIENYYFDFDTLYNPLRSFSVTDRFRDALSLFKVVFEQTIRLACAASLAGDELEKLRLVKGSANQANFQICSSAKETLTLDLNKWKNNLVRRHGLSSDLAQQLVERFQLWSDRVERSNFYVVRWMCHGHIGLAFIWAVYSRCVLEICRRQGYGEGQAAAEARRVLKAEESVRFNACAEIWVQKALGNHCSYPAEVFRLLDVSIPHA